MMGRLFRVFLDGAGRTFDLAGSPFRMNRTRSVADLEFRAQHVNVRARPLDKSTVDDSDSPEQHAGTVRAETSSGVSNRHDTGSRGWGLPESHLLSDAMLAFVDANTELSHTARARAAYHLARCPECSAEVLALLATRSAAAARKLESLNNEVLRVAGFKVTDTGESVGMSAAGSRRFQILNDNLEGLHETGSSQQQADVEAELAAIRASRRRRDESLSEFEARVGRLRATLGRRDSNADAADTNDPSQAE
jgi:hypothetical protein